MTSVHEAQLLDGKPIDWHNPPAANERVQWSKRTTAGRPVTGSLRTICHLNRLNNLALGRFKTGIAIIQPSYNTGVPASAGTHDYDACVDLYIPGVEWYTAQAFLRRNGFGCWYRHEPDFPEQHIHGFTLPNQSGVVRADDFRDGSFRVGLYVDGGISASGHQTSSSQLVDYYNHAFGLAGQHSPGSDKSWFPPDIGKTIFNLQRYIRTRAK